MDYYFKVLILALLFYLLFILRSFIRRSYGKDNKLDYWIITFILDKNLLIFVRALRFFLNWLILYLIFVFYSLFASEPIPLDWLF